MHPKLITRDQYIIALGNAGREKPAALGDYNGPILAVPVPDKNILADGHYTALMQAKYPATTDPMGPIIDIFISDKFIYRTPVSPGVNGHATDYFQADSPAVIDALIASKVAGSFVLADILRNQIKKITNNAATDKPTGFGRI